MKLIALSPALGPYQWYRPCERPWCPSCGPDWQEQTILRAERDFSSCEVVYTAVMPMRIWKSRVHRQINRLRGDYYLFKLRDNRVRVFATVNFSDSDGEVKARPLPLKGALGFITAIVHNPFWLARRPVDRSRRWQRGDVKRESGGSENLWVGKAGRGFPLDELTEAARRLYYLEHGPGWMPYAPTPENLSRAELQDLFQRALHEAKDRLNRR